MNADIIMIVVAAVIATLACTILVTAGGIFAFVQWKRHRTDNTVLTRDLPGVGVSLSVEGRSSFVTDDVMDELVSRCFRLTAGLDEGAQEGRLIFAPGYVEYQGVTVEMVLSLMGCLVWHDGWDPNDGFGRKFEVTITREGATPPPPSTSTPPPPPRGTHVVNPGTPATPPPSSTPDTPPDLDTPDNPPAP